MLTSRPKTIVADPQWQLCFRLLCWSLQENRENASDALQLIQAIERWDYFIDQLHWHRVAALAWQRLGPLGQLLPPHVVLALQQLKQKTRQLALQHSHEISRLAPQFDAHQIPFIVLKGVTLSAQLYDDPLRRFSRDMDILVAEADIEAADQLLAANGYRRTFPPPHLPARFMRHFRQLMKDCTYTHQDNGRQIELHWRFENNPYFLPLPSFQPFAHIERYAFSGTSVPVLSAEHNVLYLIMHIAHSSWARLSWLTDIARLLRQPLDWKRVISMAREQQIDAVVWVTLQLAHRLLQAPLPALPLPASWRARWLLRQIEPCLQEGHYPPTFLRLAQQFLYCPRPDFLRFHLLRKMGLSVNDMAILPLPDRLFFLYLPLRPVLWGWRRTFGPLDAISAVKAPKPKKPVATVSN